MGNIDNESYRYQDSVSLAKEQIPSLMEQKRVWKRTHIHTAIRSSTMVQRQFKGEKIYFNKCAGTIKSKVHLKKEREKETRSTSHTTNKVNSNWITGLNIHLLEEKLGEHLYGLGWDKDYWETPPKVKAHEEKIHISDFLSVKNFCSSKDTIKKRLKNDNWLGENICKTYKGLTSSIFFLNSQNFTINNWLKEKGRQRYEQKLPKGDRHSTSCWERNKLLQKCINA